METVSDLFYYNYISSIMFHLYIDLLLHCLILVLFTLAGCYINGIHR